MPQKANQPDGKPPTEQLGSDNSVSKHRYEPADETTFLLRHPANARRLMAAMQRSDRGEYGPRAIDLGAV